MQSSQQDADQKLYDILIIMMYSKYGDLREEILCRQGRAKDHVSSRGHEALVAVITQLLPQDYLFPYYRGSHLMMGKGVSRVELANDFFSNKFSSSKGICPATHFGSITKRVFPTTATVASQCLPAAGMAWGSKLFNLDYIVVCSIGDGGMREGEFYEAVAFSIEKQLPILFMVEDNQYAISTKTLDKNPLRMNIFPSEMVCKINGRNVLEVLSTSKELIHKVRSLKRPYILWCEVDRLSSHTPIDNHTIYRTEEELQQLIDPIETFAEYLINKGIINLHEYKKLEHYIQAEVKDIYQQAENCEKPSIADINFYQNNSTVKFSNQNYYKFSSLCEALNQALQFGLSHFEDLILFGQDIEDPKGGVFSITKGLSTKYPGRVINAPLTEATIIGVAGGIALTGKKVVIEIQFADFISVGFDQLANQLSTLCWRTQGQWLSSVIIYAPYGAYFDGGGLWHSQSNESWWTHIPGLQVFVPTFPDELYSLFLKAYNHIGPTLILVPKARLWEKEFPFVFIKQMDYMSRILIEGKDLSVVTWGNGIDICYKAISSLPDKEKDIELISLASLVPYNYLMLKLSLLKTKRLLVVQEDNRTSSFGATLISTLLSDNEVFRSLLMPPKLIARDDVHIPFNSQLSLKIMPSADTVQQEILSFLQNEVW